MYSFMSEPWCDCSLRPHTSPIHVDYPPFVVCPFHRVPLCGWNINLCLFMRCEGHSSLIMMMLTLIGPVAIQYYQEVHTLTFTFCNPSTLAHKYTQTLKCVFPLTCIPSDPAAMKQSDLSRTLQLNYAVRVMRMAFCTWLLLFPHITRKCPWARHGNHL